jgi:hypothetical protein
MTPTEETESLILKMEARNKATRRLLDETARMNERTGRMLIFAGALTAVAGLIVIVKAVWF